MATVVSNPVKAWLATLSAGGFISHGQALTITINLTQGWEIQVPIGVRYGSNVSLAQAINVYASDDGGATFDTLPLFALSIPTKASANQVVTIRLTTGMYAIAAFSSSPSTTVFALTQELITAINNV